MTVFSDNTAVVVWGPTASVQVNAFGLDGLVGNGGSYILVDVKANAREIVDVCQCFNDTAFVYALGNDQGRCTISLTFIVFIGKCGNEQFGNLDQGISGYTRSRISVDPGGGEVAIGSFTRHAWLLGIDVSGLEVERSACYVTVHYMMELNS